MQRLFFKYYFLPALLLLTAVPQGRAQMPGDTLQVLSWNIFMLPPFLFRSAQLERADSIGSAIRESGADVVIFQEAFMEKAREIIFSRLADKYPYHSGTPEGGGFLRFNSGIWVMSRYPLEKIKFVRYRKKAGADLFSGKGALLVRVCHPDREIYVVGTHSQAEENHQGIRFKQYRQIREEIFPLLGETEPLIVAGDLNTDKSSSMDYEEMMRIFGLEEAEKEKDSPPHSYNGEHNDLARKFFGKEKQNLDYILSRRSSRVKNGGSRVRIFRAGRPMAGGFKDLSDHYAVQTSFIITK
jgi:endonuclease/exonuclease/phosphatase family metal-dependent hydrolase